MALPGNSKTAQTKNQPHILVNQAVNEESDPQNTESRPFTLNTHPTKDPSVLLAAQVSSKLEEGQCA